MEDTKTVWIEYPLYFLPFSTSYFSTYCIGQLKVNCSSVVLVYKQVSQTLSPPVIGRTVPPTLTPLVNKSLLPGWSGCSNKQTVLKVLKRQLHFWGNQLTNSIFIIEHIKWINDLRKMYSISGHPRCRWVCIFIVSDLEKFSITSLAHQWIPCGEWVPSECPNSC